MSSSKTLLGCALCLAFLGACGSGGDNGSNTPAETCPHDYSKFTPTPSVSLRNTLLAKNGIFRASCSFAGICHGDENASLGHVYLGPGPTDTLTDEEVSHVRSNLMDKAIDAPSLSRVVPSDPANSFLMRKLDGCFTDIQSLCVVAPAESNNKCGDVMPKTGDRLDASDRDLIRSWIQEGALEN